ncbi:aa3-type cytochrome c oxidase subunit IV [Salinarimonas soli]|uniref:Aa3-type cytochrome c oxidase subunit IV n=1 Tax=Salinarimonas soli TaxID=1638099 RepID=A0A5B2VC57_9HYPH|nr:aa3-type cytochrome c oxidase subunit IV [Salinarimonas soli]KAA2236002.1 aa3-type cytochrome c oxidase subunit IV [Salinarimonas soli]
MAQIDPGPQGTYHPDMDEKTHEATYNGFTHFTMIATTVVLCHVLVLAIGGIKGGWTTSIVGVIMSLAAGAVGALVPSIGWRAPAAVAALLVVLLILY